jgi:hypothetical protein
MGKTEKRNQQFMDGGSGVKRFKGRRQKAEGRNKCIRLIQKSK